LLPYNLVCYINYIDLKKKLKRLTQFWLTQHRRQNPRCRKQHSILTAWITFW